MARRRRGFTLPEVLVVCFLGLVVLSLMAQLLVPSVMLFRVQSARSDIHQGALIFTHWVNQRLANTRLETVTVHAANPVAISFREVSEDDPFDASSGAAKVAERFRILFFDEPERRIVIKEWPPDPPHFDFDYGLASAQPSLLPDDLASICRGVNGTERVIAKNVERLVITDDDGDVAILNPPLVLSVECAEEARDRRRENDPGAVERFSMTTRIVPRNVRW